MSFSNPAHVDGILVREENLWSVWLNVDDGLFLIPCVRVQTLKHTTKKSVVTDGIKLGGTVPFFSNTL